MPFEEIAGEMSVRRGVNTLATACTFVGHARAASAALHWNGWLFPGWPQAVNKGHLCVAAGDMTTVYMVALTGWTLQWLPTGGLS